jgi:hypothetical protein
MVTGGYYMSQKHRMKLFKEQPRAFLIGSVEKMNKEWIFFDEETDEAFLLEEIVSEEFEIELDEEWFPVHHQKGEFTVSHPTRKNLENGDTIRIHQKLLYSFELLLKSLSDESFFTLAHLLNSHSFSFYDCLYCHNFLAFQSEQNPAEGVNFLVFDNNEMVCSVYHLFRITPEEQNHRFELTEATGKRYLLTQLS